MPVLTPHETRSAAWSRYGDYLRRPPLLTVEWNDSETEARGWLVINSLRGGAAGGGTRMRAGLTRREVVYLAKTMELKFAFSGPAIGGAKSGIDFDPTDPRREGVLRRWFQAMAPLLASCYGPGGDLNVDEVRDVIPCCAAVGVGHPQAGVVRGHLKPDAAGWERIRHALDVGVKAEVRGEDGVDGSGLSVADLVTGYGLARSVIHLYEAQGRSVRGARVLVEGFGAVGGPCALYLAREGAVVVGIADRDKSLVAPQGLSAREVESLLVRRDDKLLPEQPGLLRGEDRARFWETPAEVLIAAAAGGTVDEAALARLAASGVEVIACGANQPFREAQLGATRVQRDADRRFAVVPDVVANCGMARAFSYLMVDGADPRPESVFRAVDETIHGALTEILERTAGRPTGLLAAAFDLAMDRAGSA
jgi:glutamate dehydrogenase/leucine dehydrogenase